MASTKTDAVCFRVDPRIKLARQVVADHELQSLSDTREGAVVTSRHARQISVAESASKAGFVHGGWAKS